MRTVLWLFQEGSGYEVSLIREDEGIAYITGLTDTAGRWEDGPSGFAVPMSEIQWAREFVPRLYKEWRGNSLYFVQTSPTPEQEAEMEIEREIRARYGTSYAVERFSPLC